MMARTHGQGGVAVVIISRANTTTTKSPVLTRKSTRKRKQVSYHESEDEDRSYDSQDDEGPAKKAKMKVAVKEKPVLKNKAFPFMSLPAELRNKIYKFALTDPNGHYLLHQQIANRRVVFRSSAAKFWTFAKPHRKYCLCPMHARLQAERQSGFAEKAGSMSRLCPQLLAVSKVIYHEAIGYLYSDSIVFEDTYTLHWFLTAISARHRAMLRDIEVAAWGHGVAQMAVNFPAASLLADAVHLERFRIALDPSYPDQIAKRVYRDCCFLFDAYGARKGNKYAGLDLIDIADDSLILITIWDNQLKRMRSRTVKEQQRAFTHYLREQMH